MIFTHKSALYGSIIRNNGDNLNITNSTFKYNNGSDIFGFYNVGVNSIISTSLFDMNTDKYAIISNYGSNLTIINCNFFNNHSKGFGSIYNDVDGDHLSIINSSFTNNLVSIELEVFLIMLTI